MQKKLVANSHYRDFILRNRKSMNESMSRVLLICAFTGPAIALARLLGYSDVSYLSCFVMSLVLVLLSVGQRILSKYMPLGLLTVFWGVIGLMFVLTFLCTVNANIYITYALIPIVSLFYCEKSVYLISVALNYVMILVSNALMGELHVPSHTIMQEPLQWFVTVMTGYTIETVVIGAAGYYLCVRISNYFKETYSSNQELDDKLREEERKTRIGRAVTSLYQCVYVVDLKKNTYEVVQRDNFVSDVVRDEDDLETNIERGVFALVENEDKQKILDFLNIKTLPARLEKQSMVYEECMGRLHGRVQLSFILVERDAEGMPSVVVFTLRQLA